MAAGSRIEGGGTQILSAGVRKTILSIKEIVGNHSDADIYVTLKESGMDPNETAQKLLNQDPFHEVRRKRDKKKENTGYTVLIEPRKPTEHASPWVKINTNGRGGDMGLSEPGKPMEHASHRIKFNTSNRDVRRGGYNRNIVAGGGREFRVVRDNRINQNVSRDMKPAPQCLTSTGDQVNSHVSEEGGSAGTSDNKKSSSGRYSPQASEVPTVSHPRRSQDTNSSGNTRKELREDGLAAVPIDVTQLQESKPNDSQSRSALLASNHTVVGVYSSSSDPVHVPSPDSRPAATVGAIKREFGAVGVRRQSSGNSVKASSAQSTSFSNSHLGKDGTSSRESFRPFIATSKSDQPRQTTVPESLVSSMSVSRSILPNQYNSRPHQQVVNHQKASQPYKEWKPKSSPKSMLNGPGVIGTPAKSGPHPAENPKDLEMDAPQVQDKLSQINIYDNQNVFIAEHIRVSESDRCRLTFGNFGTEFDSSGSLESHAVESAENYLAESLSASASESSTDGTSASKDVDLLEDQVRKSGSSSPVSGAVIEHHLPDKQDASSPQNLDSYADIGLVHDNCSSYTPSESQQRQDPPELPSFSAYDPQTGYDIPYFRPTMDETVWGQRLPSPQEALSSHQANSIPSSTIAMVQQQQPPMAQVYPQVHVPHFANLMPYRQFLSPVYVPPVPMPGYSSNPSYSHPSNGSSYLLMPGGSSHLGANNLKYGIQQFKPVPAGSPTGFGNFASPNGYAINAPAVVGNAAGLEDSSRLKYKDGNLYVPNPQAEASEVWIQNPREISGLQSASYYNIPGQNPHAGAYLPSHTGHASFSAAAAAAAAQSSHMQFPGMYHAPPQPPAIGNPHHLGPAMGGNVGVGVAAAAPGAQVGAYQQPQLGHLNWTTNF